MSAKTTIFVSHSSQDGALTNAVVAALAEPFVDAQGVQSEGFQVLVDYEDLKPGVDWPLRLHVTMARCHAAVILLTEAAVASDWVLKEATILTWRRTLDKDGRFHCIPFAPPEVTDALLAARGFAPLDLRQIQMGAVLDAAIIAARCRELVSAAEPQSLFDQVVGRLSDNLVNVGENTLKAVATRLRIDAPPWRGPQDIETEWAADIAAAILMGHLGDYAGVQDLIDDLAQGPATHVMLNNILKWAAPAWIDLAAAGQLRIAAARPTGRSLGVNGRLLNEYTAEMFVRRAYPMTERYRVLPIAWAHAGNEVEHVTDEICKQLRGRGRYRGINDQIVAALATESAPYCLVLGPPLPSDDALRTLRTRFPTLTFLLWTGECLEEDPRLASVEWLRPPLPLDREQQGYDSYLEALDIIGRRAAAKGQ